MTEREQMIERMAAMEEDMIRLSRGRDIWRNDLM